MGLGSLLRSFSNSGRPSECRHHRQRSQQPHIVSTRRHSHVPNASAAAAALTKAKQIYEAEEANIMREELRIRQRNDLECKRHMEMLEKQKRTERRKLDDSLLSKINTAVANYRAGKISARELERSRQKHSRSTEQQWASFVKWHKGEQEKAQRIFFARGEEIGANTGAALRQARTKMERTQRAAI